MTTYPKYPTIIHALSRRRTPSGYARHCVSGSRVDLRAIRPCRDGAGAAFAQYGVARERIAFMMTNGLEALCRDARGHGGARAGLAAQSGLHRAELEPLVRDVEPRLIVWTRRRRQGRDAGAEAASRMWSSSVPAALPSKYCWRAGRRCRCLRRATLRACSSPAARPASQRAPSTRTQA